MKLIKTIDAILDRFSAVFGAILMVQAPEFFQQYLQRLGGHVDELRRQIAQLKHFSLIGGKTLHDYIQKFLTYQDADIAAQGKYMESLVVRYENFKQAWQSLSEASVWARPFKFLWYGDSEIISATWANYIPALVFSSEGVVYILLGALIGYGCYTGIKFLVMLIYYKFARLASHESK